MPETKIAFRESGSGHPLLLLHGYAGSVLHWDHVVAGIGNHYQVIVPNLTHVFMGRNALTFSEQIEILAKFIKLNFPNKKIHLAGISYGGALVWGIALKYPELIAAWNVAPPFGVERRLVVALLALCAIDLRLWFVALVAI
jgi:pimeloyl-ACP methyl ester carboxylesterase